MNKKSVPPDQRIKAIEQGLDLIKKGTPSGDAWRIVSKEFDVGTAALYRWFSIVREHPKKRWLKLLELKYKGRTVKAPFSQAAWEYFLEAYKNTSPPSQRVAYDLTVEAGKRKKWEIPVGRTFNRRMKIEGIPIRTIYDKV